MHTTTTISPAPPAVVQTVQDSSKPVQRFTESTFSLSLPAGWVFDTHRTDAGQNIYSWKSTDNKSAGREILVYVDTPVPTLGVNRAVMVQASGDKLAVTGDVSDNCAGFTSATAGAPSISSPAKWQGLDFLCDLGNYERDVVGTVSSDGINTVVLTGATSGAHHYFFTYTDNNIQPDFSPFLSALQTFQAS
ncbi:MAG TPA: hypothetical protein VFN56_05505 [Candidatus Saccharimonadales bacterium]|nr:hypothetical protein [Candidatus Saccharimonadales bacterium]